jgi:phosphate starvation-inducible protein PhoH
VSKKRRQKLSALSFDIADISPLSANQETAFKSEKNMILCGSAGSGKSFIACYLGIEALADRKQDNLVIIRSAVPTRDIGFLPGNDKEKARIYEEPYYAIFSEILQRGDAYEIIKNKGVLYFRTTSYLRGITLSNSVVVVDECQNMTMHELDSLVTRVGQNCRIIFCGDFKQADLTKNGLREFLSIIKRMPNEFDIIEFNTDDIVRSDFVKRYIIAKESINA